MLTVFSTCKPFRGPDAICQRNAVASWTRLSPRPEIILIGDEPGVRECCGEFGLRHIPEVARTVSGIPLLDDLFSRSRAAAANGLLAYVNADIILMSDFMKTVEACARLKDPWVMTGRRWNLDWNGGLIFEPGWEEKLRREVAARGKMFYPEGMDYFVFRRNFCPRLPALTVGRPWWDGWMAYAVRAAGYALIDATQAVLAVHQNHAYGPAGGIPVDWETVFDGRDAAANLRLAGGLRHIYTVDDATHRVRVRPDGDFAAVRTGPLRSFLCFLSGLWKREIWYPAVFFSRPLRRRMGLKKENFLRWKAFCGPGK